MKMGEDEGKRRVWSKRKERRRIAREVEERR